jgi:hypothetical protein
MPELNINLSVACALIEELRELGGTLEGVEDRAAEIGDDSPLANTEQRDDDPRADEVRAVVRNLSTDETIDLVALMLVGRGEFGVEDWEEARATAADRLSVGNENTVADMLLGELVAPEFLESGLAAFGFDCQDWDAETVDRRLASASSSGGEPGELGDLGDAAQAQMPGTPGHLTLKPQAGRAEPRPKGPHGQRRRGQRSEDT